MRGRTLRKVSLLASALAIITMGTVTVACTPRTEQPADPNATQSEMAPTQKNVRTNVTRTGMSAAPPPMSDSRPCGFGPGGGASCHRGGYGGYGGDGGYGGYGGDGGGGGGGG